MDGLTSFISNLASSSFPWVVVMITGLVAILAAHGNWGIKIGSGARKLLLIAGYALFPIGALITTLVAFFEFSNTYPSQLSLTWATLSSPTAVRIYALLILAVIVRGSYRRIAAWRADKPRREFSSHLNNTTKGQNISGPGQIFLTNTKTSPPFLGILSDSPVLPLKHEKTLTEYFQALEFITNNSASIRGGNNFQIRQGDTWEIAAKREYGDEKFARQLAAANQRAFRENERLPTGSYVGRPYIDVSATLGVSSEQIQAQHDIADGKYESMSKAFDFLWDDLHLTRDEALPLLKAVYDAAQLTLGKTRRPT